MAALLVIARERSEGAVIEGGERVDPFEPILGVVGRGLTVIQLILVVHP